MYEVLKILLHYHSFLLLLQEIEWVGNIQKPHKEIQYRNKRPCNQGKMARGFRAFISHFLETFVNIVPVSLCNRDKIEAAKPINDDSDDVEDDDNFHFSFTSFLFL